ncbi:hypothetical protein ABE137_12440 [Brevibacillus laterosporus]|uniref:hypothetical protein n=1 Tax=Brevibacillus phage Sundance TaxID=1691958 RepID=UPI0006BC80A9|nr:hypothetical protein AVT09_gp167 [Brevibacillus phage Sundance]ALA47983.1 hypothetical protein SUNDANCE_167 [Brevibacillus phage Sundance]
MIVTVKKDTGIDNLTHKRYYGAIVNSDGDIVIQYNDKGESQTIAKGSEGGAKSSYFKNNFIVFEA